MYPHERSLVKQLADKPFAIVGVNSDRDVKGLALEDVQKIIEKKKLNWRNFQNSSEGSTKRISDDWLVRGWPTTYLLDANGVIRYKNLRGEELDKAIQILLKEAGSEVTLVHTLDEDSAE